jgi:hypothetical protein
VGGATFAWDRLREHSSKHNYYWHIIGRADFFNREYRPEADYRHLVITGNFTNAWSVYDYRQWHLGVCFSKAIAWNIYEFCELNPNRNAAESGKLYS